MVGAEVPHAEALVECVLGYYFSVQVVDFDEVGVLNDEVLEQPPALGIARPQIIERQAPALHARVVIDLLGHDDEDALVGLIQEHTPHRLLATLINQQRLPRQPVVREADAGLCAC